MIDMNRKKKDKNQRKKRMKIENLCINCMREMKSQTGVCEHCGFDERKYDFPQHHMRPFTILAGKYLIGKAIGEGGFGITYIGMDLELEARVAIKEYYPQGAAARDSRTNDGTVRSYSENTRTFFEEGREKFINEARTIAKFRELPEIVGVIEFFRENQTAYIVMEYLDGQTLKQYLKANDGKIPADELLRMMKPLISSLGKIHSQGLIHRDISPDNIMLMKDGSIKILDFGGARDFISQNGKSLSVMVKHGYAPEEQYRSHGDQGPWTDVYALCATMYRCITGKIPPEALDRLYQDELKPISSFGVNCPKYIEQAITKGLSVRKDGRYQSMEELYDALYKEQKEPEKKHKEKNSSIELEHSEYIEHAIDRGLNVYADELYDDLQKEQIDQGLNAYADELCDALQNEQIDQGLNAYADKLYDTLRKEQRKSEKVHKSNETDTKKKENKRNVNKKNEEKKIIITAAATAAIGIAVIAGVGIKVKQPDEEVVVKTVTTPTPSTKDEMTPTPEPKNSDEEIVQTASGVNIIKQNATYYATAVECVRADCSTNSEPIDGVKMGQKLTSTGVSEDKAWFEVIMDDKVGYVRSEFVSEKALEKIQDTPSSLNNKEYLNVYNGKGSGYYGEGEKVKISTTKQSEAPYFPVWSGNGMIENPYFNETTIIMPETGKNEAYERPLRYYSDVQLKVERTKLYDESGNFIIKIEGKDYIFPMSVQEFENKGGKIEKQDIKRISGYYTQNKIKAQCLKNEKAILFIGVKIENENQIDIVSMDFCDSNLQVEVPGSISIGQSTREDVENVYGKMNSYMFETSYFLNYYIEGEVTIEFKFNQNNIVSEIIVRKIPKDYTLPQS